MNDATSKIFNEQMKQLDNEYGKLPNSQKRSCALDAILVVYFLMIMTYDFNDLFVSPRNNNEKVPPMPPLESDEEVKKGKGLKI